MICRAPPRHPFGTDYGVHDESRGEPIEIEGYLTAVTAPDGSARELYLHAQGHTFRLELPIGPEHAVRVQGWLAPGELLPTLTAKSVERVDGLDRRREP